MTNRLTVASEQQLLKALLEQVSRRAVTEQQIESEYAAVVESEQQQYHAVMQLLTETYESHQQQLDQQHEADLSTIDQGLQRTLKGIQSEYQKVLTDLEARFTGEMAAATKERDDATWLVSSLLDDNSEGSPSHRFQQQRVAAEAIGIELKTGLQSIDQGYDRVSRFLRRSHISSEFNAPPPTASLSHVEQMKSACLSAVQSSDRLAPRILSRLLPKLFLGPLPLLLFLVLSALVFSVVWGTVDPSLLKLKLKSDARDWALIVAGIAAVVGLIGTFFLHIVAVQRVWRDYEQLIQQRVDAHYAFSLWEKASNAELNQLEAECSELHELRVKRRESALAGAEAKYQNRAAEAQRLYLDKQHQAHLDYPSRLNATTAQGERQTEAVEKQYRSHSDEMSLRRRTDFERMQTEFQTRMGSEAEKYQQQWLELIHKWQSGIQALATRSDHFCATAQSLCADWESILRNEKPFPENSPPWLSLGRIQADLGLIERGSPTDPRLQSHRTRFDLPILLPMHERPSLILKSLGAGREVAVQTLQSTMLRFLTSLPPGKVRFTIIDPVGLGANFAAFMHLADIDELLVSSRIWTEPSHIEKRLADLTEHMETVLQTYLRNEFATIDDYNHFAGEVAEPYRVLVIANFPANFTDLALRRLISIAEGGRRCGVVILLSVDESLENLRGFSPSDLEKNATVLQWNTDRGFRLADPDFAAWPLKLDAPPSADDFGQIVRMAGQHARDVRRVEVPFERVAPATDQFWMSDSRKGIDIPVGRAGATKLQFLRLGKGTSQHVLVAGKTGSGKSTLLHALITNLALHYRPTEVEFYLIDFKKGVEFKVYAEQQLPHARVIAIESDREFGVSVLERLDALLRDRGEQFREVGVQDIEGFRNARPDVVMPRTLLLVDEFQEFFIEDDALSQQASLLLDRLIRQGRAFGVHILLGSQTLAGAYSLARSTLGQVAVRIALQCSDTDAHLILSEENTAARLLTRPGEAIYNDANGLIEGNHPFQIVWLGEQERLRHLLEIRRSAESLGGRGSAAIQQMSRSLPLVFEGNIPADPTANRRLNRVLSKCQHPIGAFPPGPPTSIDSPWSCWLGDSVSMGGPVELNFGLREGGNLLIVGRDEQAALGIMTTSALALCAQARSIQTTSQVISVLDGSLPNSESLQAWQHHRHFWHASDDSATGSQIMNVSAPRETAAAITQLIAELHRRTDEPGLPLFLFIYDLARFRDLRKSEDDFGYSGGFGGAADKPANCAQQFSELLRDGPAVGIFTIAWVDSYQSAQRWLGREQLNRFEQRVLFAMNANDSSSLVDSPLAGRLGENRALLYRGDLGTLEKFRPFSPPAVDWLKKLSSPPAASEPVVAHEASYVPITLPAPLPIPSTTSPAAESNFELNIQDPNVAASAADISDELPNIDELTVQ